MPNLDDVHAAIEKWYQEKLMCGDIGRYTPANNQAWAAKADLKDRITALFQPTASLFSPASVKAVTGDNKE